jgi:hypothetical protein
MKVNPIGIESKITGGDDRVTEGEEIRQDQIFAEELPLPNRSIRMISNVFLMMA